MNATTVNNSLSPVISAGLMRGKIELKQAMSGPGLFMFFFFPLLYALVLYFMRNSTVPGTEYSLGAMVLPGIVGMSIAFGGINGPAGTIGMDREDGTLLRAKATPNGMLGYLIGKIILFSGNIFLGFIPLIIPAMQVLDQLVVTARTWGILGLIFVLGMFATIPLGVALGSIVRRSTQSSYVFLFSIIVIGLSGIFYPITSMPVILQWIGQAFPFYWLGLGARSAFLPPEMMLTEIGQSWRSIEMISVLGVWSVIGLVAAPVFLKRMARLQSGSAVAQARQRIMSQGY